MKKYLKVGIDVIDSKHCSSNCEYNSMNAYCNFFHVRLKEDIDYRPIRDSSCVSSEIKTRRKKKIAIKNREKKV